MKRHFTSEENPDIYSKTTPERRRNLLFKIAIIAGIAVIAIAVAIAIVMQLLPQSPAPASPTVNYCERNGHIYSKTTVEPTCVDEGYTLYTCVVCGDTYRDGFVSATGVHTYVGVETEATCTHGAGIRYTCTTCGDSYIEERSGPLPHTFENGVCTTCGLSGEYIWADNTAFTVTFLTSDTLNWSRPGSSVDFTYALCKRNIYHYDDNGQIRTLVLDDETHTFRFIEEDELETYTTTSLIEGAETCEDGATIEILCAECGFVLRSETTHEHTFDGTTCSVCGYSVPFTDSMGNTLTIYGEEGVLKTASGEENLSMLLCKKDTYHAVWNGVHTLFLLDRENNTFYMQTEGFIDRTYTLSEGAADCIDGVTVTLQCKYCGIVLSVDYVNEHQWEEEDLVILYTPCGVTCLHVMVCPVCDVRDVVLTMENGEHHFVMTQDGTEVCEECGLSRWRDEENGLLIYCYDGTEYAFSKVG